MNITGTTLLLTMTVAVIPKPASLEVSPGLFQPRQNIAVPIDATSLPGLRSGELLLIRSRADPALGPEGYELTVATNRIVIQATTPAGLFYGLQTLRQLLPGPIPCMQIKDRPRFRWRGALLDVARHIFPKEFLKRYIDLLAYHKLNVLQLHLTDDQGWRVQIRKYPRLTQIGAWRDETTGDGKRYGGFYTQADLRELVAYAAARHVTIVPEIEMPGHSLAALAAYPEFSCTGGPFKVRTTWGIERNVLCPGNEKTFEFVQNVLDEIIRVFPSEFIHIGGDEVPKERWKACPKCQARIRAEGLKDEHHLQSYFLRRVEQHLHMRGRRLVGWSEIREGGLPPRAVLMDWKGGAVEAATRGHDVVMSPTTHCYFDYYQSQDKTKEPKAIGGFIPLPKVYSFEPIPEELPATFHKHILGAQGNLWTEYIPTPQHAEYMAFPRQCALAEVVWSPAAGRDWEDFHARLKNHLKRLIAWGVNYRPPQP
ncbi:MAG: beta-N-acetylhexosaminidase, partial [Verrucomicrobiae bacterium]|nr:beta-N-acetylhexosaminidase [Verrucomicrobiae bacterium]